MPEIPRLLEPQQLLDLLPRPDILVIDLSNEETYLSGHIPGAVHLNPGLLMSGKKPAAGRLPALENLTRGMTFITPSCHATVEIRPMLVTQYIERPDQSAGPASALIVAGDNVTILVNAQFVKQASQVF